MSYQTIYVVDLPGTAFNEQLDPACRASDVDLRHFLEEDECWEGCLPDSSVNLIVDMTGAVTLIVHPRKYSSVLYNPQVREGVLAWEQSLKQLIPVKNILRVDEFVLQHWEDKAGEFWFRNIDGFTILWNWLKQGETEGWTEV